MEERSNIEAINKIIQQRLEPLYGTRRSVELRYKPGGGMGVLVDGKFYESLSEVEDASIQYLIQASIDDWRGKSATAGRDLPRVSTPPTRSTVRRSRGWLGTIALIVVALTVLSGVGYLVISPMGREQNGEWLAVANDFMEAMALKNLNQAYSLLSSDTQSDLPLVELGEFLRDPMFSLFNGYTGMELTGWQISFGLQGFSGELYSSVSYAGGYIGTFEAVFVREKGRWRLLSFDVLVQPEKFQ